MCKASSEKSVEIIMVCIVKCCFTEFNCSERMINILTTSCILQSTRQLVFSVSLCSHNISVPTEQVVELADKLLSAEGGAALAGLGAVDDV